MPVSVSCLRHVKGEGGAPACLCQFPAPVTFKGEGGGPGCLCQFPAPATLREKEEIRYACVSFLLLPRYVRRGSSAGLPSPPPQAFEPGCLLCPSASGGFPVGCRVFFRQWRRSSHRSHASVRGVLVRMFIRGRPVVTQVGVVVLFFIRSPPAVACDFSSWRGRPS